MPDPGTKLGRYEIRSKIGEGGMGEVYLAQDTKLDRKVAIKFLNQQFSKDEDKLNRSKMARAGGVNCIWPEISSRPPCSAGAGTQYGRYETRGAHFGGRNDLNLTNIPLRYL